ncbi:MAG TPA: alanine--tRNA ligase [Anaerolineae bacterium]|nr:alanine--tRNA ligase [Anaerolineae bacterium]
MISSSEIRSSFLAFFRSKGHTVVPSSSLIPANDPTLLFANAGMVQFKDVFIGAEKRPYTRATTAQKCMRVSGKHNDLENVGPSPRHHTFFEMLGNFSFGDYFKRDAIAFAWEFLTQVLGLDKNRLYPTVYLDDDEAFQLWQEIAGVPATRITRLGKKDNFWSMGDTGPNGPCSEIHYDRGPEHCTCHRSDCNLASACERWWELWNLVFMQFETTADGVTRPLPRPSIDTGMGMERITAVLQGKPSNYETDLFWPIIRRIQELLRHTDKQRDQGMVSYRVIADHARAIAFLMADGMLPGNEGRSYVLRLILRRAARHGRMLGFRTPFMAEAIKVVVDTMGSHYQELQERRDFILQATTQEEERFLQTLDVGLNLLDGIVESLRQSGQTVIPGDKAFRLYDTYGFPLDLTRDLAKEHQLTIDEAGYHQAMEAQRERARSAQRFGVAQEQELYQSLHLAAEPFVGYDSLTAEATVVALVRDGTPQDEVGPGQEVQVVLDRTPFYGEGGGQVGDKGEIVGPRGRIVIQDTRHPMPEITAHIGQVSQGTLRVGDRVQARVDEDNRLDVARNHTATHLLHHALQKTLGDHARQAGSLVAPDRLRFDFTHLQAVTTDELRQIEREVNAAIRADLPVASAVTSFDQARSAGAIALFGEKYGDTVRMITVGDAYSRELCGGTHLRSTGQIGLFHILSESSVGAGLRRIEAITGRGAEAFFHEQLELISRVADTLEARPADLLQKAADLTEQLKAQQREITALRSQTLREKARELVQSAAAIGDTRVVSAPVQADSAERLRELVDLIREGLAQHSAGAPPTESLIVLGSVIAGRVALIAAASAGLVKRGVHAGKLVGEVARSIGGSGGGRPEMGQAGGGDPDRLSTALALARQRAHELLGGDQGQGQG